MSAARVAVVGFAHEVNSLAAPVTRAHGRDLSAVTRDLATTWHAGPFVAVIQGLRDVEIVALPVWEFGASGPLDGRDFGQILDEVEVALASAGALDGVVVLGHGAGRTTADRDPDGTFLELVRAAVGDRVPVVVVLDLHANVSARMCAAVDAVIGYRTNPHVDIQERAAEAAVVLDRLLDGERTVVALCRLPIVLPQIAQLTTGDEPLGRVVEIGQHGVSPPVINVSVFGGFALTDVEDCGLAVVVTGTADGRSTVEELAAEVATAAWELRHDFRLTATSVADAVEIAAEAASGTRPPVLFADVADNPGGGAPGNTTFILRALHDAGVRHVVMGLQFDPGVVDAVWAAGVGAEVDVMFNSGSVDPLAQPFAARGRVLTLGDGEFVPAHGIYRGATRAPGRTCALDIDGIEVAVSTRRIQTADTDTLLHAGLDPASARVVVVKSRGHFRAGFDHLFAPEQIVEVGAPGVATPVLASVDWHHLPRPVFPLDDIATFEPSVVVSEARESAR